VKRAALVFILGACAGAQEAPQAGPTAAAPERELAFVEVAAPREVFFVHEPIRLRLRVGFDATFFRSNAIQPFHQRLDVPVHLHAPWLRGLPGTVIRDDNLGGSGGQRKLLSLALNDGIARAALVEDRLKDGTRFTVLEIEKTLLPVASGELVIPEPLLSFAYATRFRDDLFGGRMPVDRREASVTGRRLPLRIDPLPEEGRPLTFGGAVGRFTARAEATPQDVAAGESLKVVLHIEGEGNHGFFDPPRLDSLKLFHVSGMIEDQGPVRHTVTYDLIPLSDAVAEVPPIALAFFDPGPPAGYRTVRTRPIPLRVRPPADPLRLEMLARHSKRRTIPGQNDIFDLKPFTAFNAGAGARKLSPAVLLSALLLPWIVALGLLCWSRAKEHDRNDPDRVRARRAAATFKSRAALSGADLASAFADYLAARLRCSPAAVITGDLLAKLSNAGVPAELTHRAARHLEVLVAAKYGGNPNQVGAAAVQALVSELENFFKSAEAAR
jgi:hypothetical protein